ncbi:methyltransferase domain-containing protein [Actinomadura roseirufa]|uniref:methyltransferase domain-containing protein n=1 Tax=Actinomadura roseirufa TaxID=2094049 RepID=UPI0013F17869|nr:methyltransferase [Actinomadura roseirufa]
MTESNVLQNFGLDAIDMSDVYSPEYTAHIEQIRHEAALVLARIAMKHVFADGEAVHDPQLAAPEGVTARQPFFFRKRLIEYLDDRGELHREGNLYRPTDELVQRASAREEDYFGTAAQSPTLRALKSIESIAGGILEGKDGLVLLEERLGAEETWRIWQYLMVDAPPKKACNSLVARTLDQRLRAGVPTVVFEGGAGLGATLREAVQIDGFRERTRNIELYGFTDISRPLMQRAREMLQEKAPEMLGSTCFDRIDLDQLDDYDDVPYLQDAAADLVIFESVLHDVENLHQVLTSCHRILKPGGWLVFTVGSRHRPGLFFPCELLQTTLHSYHRAELDPPRRTNVGYLSLEEWTASLHDAGFPSLRVFPDAQHREKWPYGGIVASRPE